MKKKVKTEQINFDNLKIEQVGKLFPIRIVPYNSDWKELFEREKALLTEVLGVNLVLNIEHIGSTSVAGLASKPVIDILIEVSNLSGEIKQAMTKKLETIGYGNMYNTEKKTKMTFGKGYDKNYINRQAFHVHIREKNIVTQEEIYFRDYLRQNPDVRDEYAKLKYELAEKHRFNREDYTRAKTDFIMRITEQQKLKGSK
jgi:GrpB-like predicted nucleotidyltransferase (UPF0157 family)